MTDEKRPADRVVELFLFAPVGLAVSVKELLPGLVERGRQQVTNQVTMARLLGEYAVKHGQGEAGKAFDRAREQAQATLEQLGVLGDDGPAPAGRPAPAAATPDPAAPAPAPAPRPTAPAPTEPTPAAPAAPSPDPVPVSGAGTAPAPAPAAPPVAPGATVALAIPDYDSLSASQVLPRLSGLDIDELEAVRAHEAANRGRKTILNKVAALQAP